PAYDIQLSGTGDLVMTDLHGTAASLALAAELTGRLYVRDQSGHLLCELKKSAGHPVDLGLEPGVYKVTLESDGKAYEAEVSLEQGHRKELTARAFTAVSTERTVA